MGITVTTSDQQITASVGETQIDVTVSGGIGPAGPAGAAGASSWSDITGKPSTFTPSAHTHDYAASSHAHGNITAAGHIIENTPDTFIDSVDSVVVLPDGSIASYKDAPTADVHVGAMHVQYGVTVGSPGIMFSDSSVQTVAWPGSLTYTDVGAAALSHAHGELTSDGKVGTTSGLVLKTGTGGAVEALAQGTAGQVLKVNGTATGVEWGAAAADVSIDATAADVLSASSGSISADDAGADKIVFWDDSAGKLTYLSAGTNITITDTTISAAGSSSASDLTTGTLSDSRLSTNAQAAINLYLWSSFR